MKSNLIILFVILVVGCISYPQKKSSKQTSNVYKNEIYNIYKIDSINSFYLVYCEKDGQKYKIVSKKTNNVSKKNRGIKIGVSYNFTLDIYPNKKDNNPLTNGNSTPYVLSCYMFDEKTKICKDEGINGLYTTNKLQGLNYIE